MPIPQSIVNTNESAPRFLQSQNVARTMALSLGGVKIKQDLEGRYCLNDLHKAAVADGANKRTKEPGKYMATESFTEMFDELTTQNPGSLPVVTIEGRSGGTYVVKELIYAYAMWVNARFHLHVIRTFDAVVIGHIQLVEGKQARERARLEAPALSTPKLCAASSRSSPMTKKPASSRRAISKRSSTSALSA